MHTGIEKVVDNHETAIRELNKNVNKIAIDLNILINNHAHLQTTTNKILEKNEILCDKIDTIEREREFKGSLWKAIKNNATTVAAVALPSAGVIGTVLYEVGKYLRHLPVN